MHTWLPYKRHREQPTVSEAPAVVAAHISVSHPGVSTLALHDVSVTVPVGARVALVGPNGAGKSTLFKAIAGLLPMRSGHLHIFGVPLGACHHRVAYLPQRSALDWRFPISVRKLVLTGRYVHLGWLRRPSRYDRQVVDEALERMGIVHLAERQIGQLSGGQQQRALLARALAQEADLLLLDEPLAAVDAATRATLDAVLDALQHQGKTFIVATHDLDQLHAYDKVVALHGGHMVKPPTSTFAEPPLGKDSVWNG